MSIAELTLADGRPLTLDIPDSDTPEWIAQVARDERARVRELFKAFGEMVAARNLRAGAQQAAMRRMHMGRGWSAKTLLNLFAAYRNGGHKPGDWRKLGPIYPAGDWRVLLRDYSGNESVLPAEFVRWLGEQWTQFKGRDDCVRALWRHVVQEIWLKGKPVPGYGTVDEWCKIAGRARPHPLLIRPGELPNGWSEATFRRHLPKRRVVQQQMAHSYLAAHGFHPDQVLTDRSPLLPLQYVFLDDSRPDVRCLYLSGGRGEIVYPLIVLGMDAACGIDVANCAKPRALKSPDAEDALERKQRHGVTQDLALTVVVETLRRWGLPPYPITFVHENAAACVPSEAKRILEEAYGDRIRFEATGVFREKMMEHGFTDGGGCPWDKAPIESFWRVLMTQIANLPGATGPRYDTAPGELKQAEAYTLELVKGAGAMPEVMALFRKPLLDFTEAHTAIERALSLLRFRTNHSLQGFDRVREFRRSAAENYQPMDAFLGLPIEEQNAVSDIIDRRECPAERFCRLLRGVKLEPVDEDLLAWIEGPRRTVAVRDGKITVKAIEQSDDRIIFRETDHPLLTSEHEGREFEAVISRDGDRIILTDEGRILGSVQAQARVNRADEEAMKKEMGRVRAARAADRDMLRGYLLADTNEALADMHRHNAAAKSSLLEAGTPAPAIAAGKRKTPQVTSAQARRNALRAEQLQAAARSELEADSL